MFVSKIIIHHSLTKDGQSVDWAAIRRYHVDHLHWADVGYHYGIEQIDGSWQILKGRMDTESGAHCLGFNHDSIGVCVVGNYDLAAPPEEALALLRRLVRSLMWIYGVATPNVIGHWESYAVRGIIPQKSCPGRKFDLDAFRQSLQ